jgi:hypothetical protein
MANNLKEWRLPLQPTAVFLPLIAILSLSGLVGLQQGRLNQITEQGTSEQYRQDVLRQKASLGLWQKLPRGNFSNLIADWSFLQFFQYFGDQPARNVTGHGLNPDFLATVVNHDPGFVDAYLYMSPASSLYAGRPDQTVKIMDRGLKSLSPEISNSHWIWIYKGVDELLFLENVAKAKHSYTMGTQWARQQQIQDEQTRSLIQSSQATIAYLERGHIGRTVRINAWLMLLGNAKDDVTLQRFILDKIVSLGATVSISPEGRVKVDMPKDDL